MSDIKMTEEWRTVKEYPQYEVSNTGKLRHVENGEIEGPRVNMRSMGKYKTRRTRIAREVYRAFVGEIPEGRAVICKVRGKGWGLDNIYLQGEKTDTKYKTSNTAKIIKMSADGAGGTEIAALLGISPSAVSHCLKRHKKNEEKK